MEENIEKIQDILKKSPDWLARKTLNFIEGESEASKYSPASVSIGTKFVSKNGSGGSERKNSRNCE